MVSATVAAVAVVPQTPSVTNPSLTGEAPLPRAGEKDADGRTVYRARLTGHLTNYYEEKIPPYTLPDPLKMNDARRVVDSQMWLKDRRPEILQMFQTEIYGKVPDTAPKVRWEVASTDPQARDGAAIMKRVVGYMGDGPDAPAMNVTMYTPARAAGPVPMVLTITFGGGPARGRGAAAPAAGGAVGQGDPIADILARGWGYATIGYGDIEGDTYNTSLSRVRKLALKPGQARPAPDEWGTISAWAWGVSRIVDYFETDKTVDAKQIAIEGHSRLGKTVLWAGAQDPASRRFSRVAAARWCRFGAARLWRITGRYGLRLLLAVCWQYPEVRRTVGQTARRPAFCNFTGRAPAAVSQRRTGRSMVRPQRRVSRRRCCGSGLPAPREERHGDDRTSADGSTDHRRRHRLNYHSEGHQKPRPRDWQAFLKFLDKYFKAPGIN